MVLSKWWRYHQQSGGTEVTCRSLGQSPQLQSRNRDLTSTHRVDMTSWDEIVLMCFRACTSTCWVSESKFIILQWICGSHHGKTEDDCIPRVDVQVVSPLSSQESTMNKGPMLDSKFTLQAIVLLSLALLLHCVLGMSRYDLSSIYLWSTRRNWLLIYLVRPPRASRVEQDSCHDFLFNG